MFWLSAALFCVALPAVCQNIKADIAAINNAYRKLNKFSYTFELNMFENYQTQNVYYTQSGVIQKIGNSTFQKFDDTECLNTAEYSIMIDREEREVVYAPRKLTFSHDDPALKIDLDTLLMLCKSHDFKKISEKSYCYSFIMTDLYPDYRQVAIYFNPENHYLSKIVFYCEEDDISTGNDPERLAKSRIEINYKNMDTAPDLVHSDFSFEKYLVKTGNQFKLKPELKNYHLTVLSF